MKRHPLPIQFLALLGLIFALISALLWWNMITHMQDRTNLHIDTWTNLQKQVTQSAARATAAWIELRVTEQGFPIRKAEQEAFDRFVASVRLIQDGESFLAAPTHLMIAGENTDTDYQESLRAWLETQPDAINTEELLAGMENGTSGSSWFLHSAEHGKEFISWSAVRAGGVDYIVGIATPEKSILAFAGIQLEYRRNIIGVAGLTLLLALVWVLIWLNERREKLRVTELEHAVTEQTRELSRSETLYRTLVEQITAITYIDRLDEDSSSIYTSPQVLPMLGYTPEEWTTQPDLWMSIIHPEDVDRVAAEHRRTNAAGIPWIIDYRMISRDGRVVWVHDEAVLTTINGVQYWHGIMHDITERKRMEDRLRYLSNHDVLTGLYNRTYFEEELTRMEHSRRFPISVIVMDVDRLKSINDEFGHAAGDEILRRVARLARRAFRSEDLIARTGGDEFTIILPNTDAEAALKVLERVHIHLEEDNRSGAQPVLGLSIGVATAGLDDTLPAALLRADDAMYQDKRSKNLPK